MITRDRIINDVIKAHPETIGVFNQFKVDSCCGGGRPIAETAQADGVADMTGLLHALNRAARRLAEKTPTEVVEEILKTHHVYLKEEMPELQAEVAELAEAVEGEEASRQAAELKRALASLASEIAEHLFKEEQILFPTIRELDAAVSGGADVTPAVMGCGAQGPVAQMNFEHEQAKAALGRIHAALEGLEATGEESSRTEALRPRLVRLRDDLLEHIRAEEEDLFPRALELEARAVELIHGSLGDLD